MAAIKQLERLKKLNKKIIAENTGTPKEFSKYLGISQGYLAYLIEKLRTKGVSVHYSRKRKTYYYPPGIKLKVEYSLLIETANGDIDLQWF